MTEQENLENVIEGLECCIGFGDNYCDVCPYSLNEFECDREKLKADALALLKEKEPIEPKIIDTSNSKLYHSDMFKNYYCGNCGEFLHVINRRDMFCSQCGRKVKWDG